MTCWSQIRTKSLLYDPGIKMICPNIKSLTNNFNNFEVDISDLFFILIFWFQLRHEIINSNFTLMAFTILFQQIILISRRECTKKKSLRIKILSVNTNAVKNCNSIRVKTMINRWIFIIHSSLSFFWQRYSGICRTALESIWNVDFSNHTVGGDFIIDILHNANATTVENLNSIAELRFLIFIQDFPARVSRYATLISYW